VVGPGVRQGSCTGIRRARDIEITLQDQKMEEDTPRGG
jgi:hypothetical protein